MKEIVIKKNHLKNKLKSKYFIVVLSNEENLRRCLDNNIAGFPETDNGVWAYLDIGKNDYISFYYNGRIFNLYKVEEKYIPNGFLGKKAIGNKKYDPEPLLNGKSWKAIKKKNNYIYFPYRLHLSLVIRTTFETSFIFKEGFERFGMNLIPRTSLKKTHFQLAINEIKKIFNIKNINIYPNDFNLTDFIEMGKRKLPNDFDYSIKKLINKENTLQSLIKRILEASITIYEDILNPNIHNDFEFFSEQTIYGGEADIVITNGLENVAFIEVKNKAILSKKDKFTKDGIKAYEQVKNYKDIFNPSKEIKKFIAGTRKMEEDILLKIRKKDKINIIEINTEFKLPKE